MLRVLIGPVMLTVAVFEQGTFCVLVFDAAGTHLEEIPFTLQMIYP